MNDSRSVASSRSSQKSYKSKAETLAAEKRRRFEIKISELHLNPEELELEARAKAQRDYNKMVETRYKGLVANTRLVHEQEDRSFKVDAEDDLIAGMARKDLVELTNRMKAELVKLDAELREIRGEVRERRERRDELFKRKEDSKREKEKKMSSRK
jgi:hypothetical protein